jgi:molecular chaperone DnaK (HSP70)
MVGERRSGSTVLPSLRRPRRAVRATGRLGDVTFTTAEPHQSSIAIKPFQGEKSLAARNKELGLFEVTEIPPAAAGEPQKAVERDAGGLALFRHDRRAEVP